MLDNMHEAKLDEERPTKPTEEDEVTAEQEHCVVKFDIGSFVLCHRKLSQLIQPLVKCYESFVHLTRWRSPGVTLVVMVVSIYLSIKYPVYLVLIPMIYSLVVLSLSGVRKLGSKTTKDNLILRKKKLKMKDNDNDLDLKIAAMKQAREDLRDYIDISIQIHAVEETLCKYLETFYRICRWEEKSLSKICLTALLSASLFLFLLPGRYLITLAIISMFIGNSDFKKVSRQAFVQFNLMLQQLRNYIYSHKHWLSRLYTAKTRVSSKVWRGSEAAENGNGEEWYDAEQVVSTSESESYEDDHELDDDEDLPTTRRRARLFSGLSSHFADYRKKQKRINSGNCASCDVSFSSLLKKRQYCRHCGDSFCSRCCSQRVKRAVFGATAPAAYEETVLVCNSCYGLLMSKAYGLNTDIW